MNRGGQIASYFFSIDKTLNCDNKLFFKSDFSDLSFQLVTVIKNCNVIVKLL